MDGLDPKAGADDGRWLKGHHHHHKGCQTRKAGLKEPSASTRRQAAGARAQNKRPGICSRIVLSRDTGSRVVAL